MHAVTQVHRSLAYRSALAPTTCALNPYICHFLHHNNGCAHSAEDTNHSQFQIHNTERQHTVSTSLQRNRS